MMRKFSPQKGDFAGLDVYVYRYVHTFILDRHTFQKKSFSHSTPYDTSGGMEEIIIFYSNTLYSLVPRLERSFDI